MADCGATEISWFLILSVATACPDTCRSSGCWRSAAGRAPPSGHTVAISSACVVAALGLGGAEVNPLCFQPFGGYGDETNVANGAATPPEMPGIGFETKPALRDFLATLVDV